MIELPTMTTAGKTRSVLDRGLDTSGGLGFVRERLALLGKTVFLLSFGFYVFLTASLALVGGAPFTELVRAPVALGHLCASLTIGVLWLVARRPTTSLATLGTLDAFCLIAGGGWLAVMALDDQNQILTALMAVMVTVMTRAILVPSRPGRTTLITALMFAPTVAMTVVRHHPTDLMAGFSPWYQKLHLTLNTILWSVLGTTLATVASRVTYGLRRQVAEASELGQYILEEKIGAGGMGEVWRARHRMLIRPAAIKLIRGQVLTSMSGDPDVLMRRFEREARATAALKSPHTVQLYDFGATDDGTLYYVMELLDGIDLDTLVRRYGPLPAERAIHILRQVCSSLADAHANGMVHRDVKPANVVVNRTGTTFDFAKVLDFGLVKLESTRSHDKDAVNLTALGTAGGTPAFIAPEVVLGAAETDHRVDIYSLGCVAYWLLTGKVVFESDNVMQVMIDHARTPPARPSLRIELPIPPELEDVVMECLAKEPGPRPASAEILSARLANVPLASAWTLERAERWWALHLPTRTDARPVADILLSHESHQRRIGPRARPLG
jgi:eukaryotic-like serine/threonine-protein kinase